MGRRRKVVYPPWPPADDRNIALQCETRGRSNCSTLIFPYGHRTVLCVVPNTDVLVDGCPIPLPCFFVNKWKSKLKESA